MCIMTITLTRAHKQLLVHKLVNLFAYLQSVRISCPCLSCNKWGWGLRYMVGVFFFFLNYYYLREGKSLKLLH